MDDATFVDTYREGRHGAFCQVRLTCGHWSGHLSTFSSVFDFPSDPLSCEACGTERQMDLRLQIHLAETA